MLNKALAGLMKFGKSLQGSEAVVKHGDLAVPAAPSRTTAKTPTVDPAMQSQTATALWAALGGPANVRTLKTVAGTRLRVELLDPRRFHLQQAQLAGVLAVAYVTSQVIHLIVGPNAARIEADLRAL